MTPRLAALCCAAALAGCAHSEPGEFTPTIAGPRTTGAMIQLTYNPGQNYWPTWTADGAGILYQFVPAGSGAYHHCIGLMPAGGGTNTWQLCDDRPAEVDTAISYSGYALGQDGRLLYAEAVAPLIANVVPARGQTEPTRTTLWLADSSKPFSRTALLQLPTRVSGSLVSWLSDIAWTDPNSFVALGQDFSIVGPATPPCNFEQDTAFDASGSVLAGTISGTTASLQPIDGTAGATGYALTDRGTSVVFIRIDDPRLFEVPVTGGTPTTIATVPLSGSQLLGVSCNDVTCVVAASDVTLTGGAACPAGHSAFNQLFAVDLASGGVQSIATALELFATPAISPTGGNVVVTVGGNMGHLQTYASADIGRLYLYPGLVQ